MFILSRSSKWHGNFFLVPRHPTPAPRSAPRLNWMRCFLGGGWESSEEPGLWRVKSSLKKTKARLLLFSWRYVCNCVREPLRFVAVLHLSFSAVINYAETSVGHWSCQRNHCIPPFKANVCLTGCLVYNMLFLQSISSWCWMSILGHPF